MKEKLVEGIDFYYNDKGYIVLTEYFHLQKGYCCGLGCLHCPYGNKDTTTVDCPLPSDAQKE